jgi:hypothetical protein
VAKEVIVFPDTEALVIAYLNAKYVGNVTYATVKAGVNVPESRPNLFTRLYRVGGSVPEIVMERSTFLVECYGLTTVTASALARFTQASLLAVDEVSNVALYTPQLFSALANLPDPNVDTHERYTFTYSVGARGVAL